MRLTSCAVLLCCLVMCHLLCCDVPGMWLTKFKDTAYVVMQEPSHAHATRKKLQVRRLQTDMQQRVVRYRVTAHQDSTPALWHLAVALDMWFLCLEVWFDLFSTFVHSLNCSAAWVWQKMHEHH